MGMEYGRWKEVPRALRGEESGPVCVEARLRKMACKAVSILPLLLLGGSWKKGFIGEYPSSLR